MLVAWLSVVSKSVLRSVVSCYAYKALFQRLLFDVGQRADL